MRNRELINRKLEILEGRLETLRYLASQGKDLNEYYTAIESSKEVVSEIKSLIELQDITPDEYN